MSKYNIPASIFYTEEVADRIRSAVLNSVLKIIPCADAVVVSDAIWDAMNSVNLDRILAEQFKQLGLTPEDVKDWPLPFLTYRSIGDVSARTKHKPQPVQLCKLTGKVCYKPNKIVQDFFLFSSLSLEDIRLVGFLNNEYEHFLQLLGCPLDCMSDSSYFFNKTLSEIDNEYANQWHTRHNEVVRYIYKKVVPNHCKWYAFSNYDDYTEEDKAQFKQLVGDF